jgi:O-antigen ligase
MFLTKGEAIRNILIFGNFSLWLLTLRYRKNLYLLKGLIPNLFWLCTGITVFSVVFSIDPLYSFSELRSEPLKAALLFPVIATVMANEKSLVRAVYTMYFTTILIVSIAYYSYFMHDIPVLKPDTVLMHAWHNKFARYLCTVLPFGFILYFIWERNWLKVFLIISIVLSVFALILSTSRGGYIAFFSIVCVWTVYLAREKTFSLKKALAIILSAVIFVGSVSMIFFPPVKERIYQLPEQLSTVNQRTETWISLLYASKEKLLFGWGYGERIFFQSEPYENSPYRKTPPPILGPHNTFLKILFHQGITSLVPYIILILLSIKEFWKKTNSQLKIKNYILVACVSVLIGNYILHSMLAVHYMHQLVIVLGFGIASSSPDE